MARALPVRGAAVLLTALTAPALAGPGAETQEQSLPEPAEVAAQVDALMEGAWKEEGVRPRRDASDAEFLRRAALDLTGAIPSEDLVREFLGARASQTKRRGRAIAMLLDDPGFARAMALRWSYLLVGRDYLFRSLNYRRFRQMQDRSMGGSMSGGMDGGSADDDLPVPPLVAWLEEQLEADVGWDAVARDLLAAEGRSDEDGATHYAVRYARGGGGAEEITGNAMRVFQGLQIQCAQCHDHPYTDWTQEQFYGVAAFFARTRARPIREGDRRIAFQVVERRGGQARIPAAEGERGRLVLPAFLTGERIPPGPGVARRESLAELVTADDNPWFAPATVNRMWSFFFGAGIVNPVDDMEQTGVPHEAVLELLSDDLRRSGYSLRRLAEVIVSTRAYQLSSAGPAEGRGEELWLFARAPLRSLSAEQLFFSVLQATGTEEIRPTGLRQRRRLERMKFGLLRQFLQTFGDDEAAEVVDEGTIPQALMLLNGPLTNDAVRPRPGHPLYDRLFALRDTDARTELVYLRVLGREPSRRERRVVEKLVSSRVARSARGKARAWADVVWALLNSAEFSLNH